MAVPPGDGKSQRYQAGVFPAATRIGSARQQAQSRVSNCSGPGKGRRKGTLSPPHRWPFTAAAWRRSAR